MKLLAVLTTLMVLISGCAHERVVELKERKADVPKYSLVLKEKLGNTVAFGDIELPAPMPTAGATFEGGWRLTSDGAYFPLVRTTGRYSASLAGGLYSFDLSGGIPDDGIRLAGLLTDGGIQGRWTYDTIAGGREMGQFFIKVSSPPKH